MWGIDLCFIQCVKCTHTDGKMSPQSSNFAFQQGNTNGSRPKTIARSTSLHLDQVHGSSMLFAHVPVQIKADSVVQPNLKLPFHLEPHTQFAIHKVIQAVVRKNAIQRVQQAERWSKAALDGLVYRC